jgi:hypothetical protein
MELLAVLLKLLALISSLIQGETNFVCYYGTTCSSRICCNLRGTKSAFILGLEGLLLSDKASLQDNHKSWPQILDLKLGIRIQLTTTPSCPLPWKIHPTIVVPWRISTL